MSDLITRARVFATAAHAAIKQLRKYTYEPYIAHPEEVADLVDWLTDVSHPEDGNRAVRKAIDRSHLEEAPGEAQTIKLCDLISNLKSIKAYDTDFTPVYLSEMRKLVEVMTKANHKIRLRAFECLPYKPLV